MTGTRLPRFERFHNVIGREAPNSNPAFYRALYRLGCCPIQLYLQKLRGNQGPCMAHQSAGGCREPGSRISTVPPAVLIGQPGCPPRDDPRAQRTTSRRPAKQHFQIGMLGSPSINPRPNSKLSKFLHDGRRCLALELYLAPAGRACTGP